MSDEERFTLRDPNAKSLALRNDSRFLGSRVTNRVAAELLNVSQGYLSDWKRDNLQRFFNVMAAHGMMIVDKDDDRTPKRILKAYEVLVTEYMATRTGSEPDTAPGELGER